MPTLVLAEHDNATLKSATLHAITSASKLGDEVHVLVVADAALGRAHGQQVLHAIAEHRVDGVVVVAPERERDDQRALRCAQPLPDVVVEPHHLGRLVELRDGQAIHRTIPFELRFGHGPGSISQAG